MVPKVPRVGPGLGWDRDPQELVGGGLWGLWSPCPPWRPRPGLTQGQGWLEREGSSSSLGPPPAATVEHPAARQLLIRETPKSPPRHGAPRPDPGRRRVPRGPHPKCSWTGAPDISLGGGSDGAVSRVCLGQQRPPPSQGHPGPRAQPLHWPSPAAALLGPHNSHCLVSRLWGPDGSRVGLGGGCSWTRVTRLSGCTVGA